MLKRNQMAVAILATTLGWVSIPQASAQNPGYDLNQGQLLLGFNAISGQGDTSSLLINLGDSTLFRDASSNLTNFMNIGTILAATYGSDWYENTNLFFGAGITWSNESPISSALNDGDPAQTVYTTKARNTVGTEGLVGSTLSTPNAANLATASSALLSLQNRFELSGTGSISVLDESLANTWEDIATVNGSGVQGGTFGFVSGGIQFRFGSGKVGTFSTGDVEGALDLYRIQGRNNIPGQYGEGDPNLTPEFLGTFTIDQNGNLSYITAVPEPSATMLGLTALAGLAARRRRKTSTSA